MIRNEILVRNRSQYFLFTEQKEFIQKVYGERNQKSGMRVD